LNSGWFCISSITRISGSTSRITRSKVEPETPAVVAAERRPATHEAKSAEAVLAAEISRATDKEKARMAGFSGNMRAKIGRYG